MPPRAAILIDNGYLDKVLKHEFGGTKLDYKDFSDNICKDNGCERAYTTVYDGSPYGSNNPTSSENKEYSRRRLFFATLEKLPNFKVKFGRQLPDYDDSGRITGYRQKGVDALIILDLIDAIQDPKKDIERIFLISGDANFEPAIKRIIQSQRVSITLCHCHKLTSNGLKGYHTRYLCKECSNCYDITQDLINRCFQI